MSLKDFIMPEMKMGRPEFENTVFILNKQPTALNIKEFAMDGDLYPEPMDKVAWAMPAFLSDQYNLFFVFAPNMKGRWSISCSRVTIKNGNEITAMSDVVPIGSGLNAVNQVSPASAINLIAYLKTLESNKLGYFDENIWKEMV